MTPSSETSRPSRRVDEPRAENDARAVADSADRRDLHAFRVGLRELLDGLRGRYATLDEC